MLAKIFFSFVLFFISVFFCFSQITIADSDMPVGDDTLRYSVASADLAMDFDTTGEDILWDYSGLDTVSQGLEEYRFAIDINPAYSWFFGINAYGLKTADSIGMGDYVIHDMYDFFSLSDIVFQAEGRGMTYQGMPIPSFYSDEDEIYQFPLEYGDLDSTTFAVATTLIDLLYMSQTGSRVNEVVGWGTIVTPYGTFDVIKVKTIIYQTDTIIISQIPFPIVTYTITQEYKWLAEGEKYPILKVEGTLTDEVFTISEITYRDIYHQSLDPAFYVGFVADTTVGYTTDIFTLMDTSLLDGLRIWSILPVDFAYVNGTDNMSENAEVQFSAPGYYSVSMTKYTSYGNHTETKTDYIYVMYEESINDPGVNNIIQIYPNPTEGILNVSIQDNKELVSVTLYDTKGQEISNYLMQHSGTIDISDLQQGIYFIQYKTNRLTGFHRVMLVK